MRFTVYQLLLEGANPQNKMAFFVFIILPVAREGTEGKNQGELLEVSPYQGFGLHSFPCLHFSIRISFFPQVEEEVTPS